MSRFIGTFRSFFATIRIHPIKSTYIIGATTLGISSYYKSGWDTHDELNILSFRQYNHSRRICQSEDAHAAFMVLMMWSFIFPPLFITIPFVAGYAGGNISDIILLDLSDDERRTFDEYIKLKTHRFDTDSNASGGGTGNPQITYF